MRLTPLASLHASLSLPLLLGQAAAAPSTLLARQDPGSSAPTGQQIAVASYINPTADAAAWDRLLSYDDGKISVLVANVLNGPDYLPNDAWKSIINRAAGKGRKIIGYVRTGYLGVSSQTYTTRLGSSNLADWVSQIEQDVDKWFELYGTNVSGIFFDEGWPRCGPDNIYANTYAHINRYTKLKYPGSFTVLNPGSYIDQCYEDTMDALLTFEDSYEAYQTKYDANKWVAKDPRKIWHIIYRVPEDKIASVAAQARDRHAGLLQITDKDKPNPYEKLPSDSYMRAVMAAVPGGEPAVAEPAELDGSYVAGLPADAAVSFADYSSVKLQWSAVPQALGYAVYKNGAAVLELPPSLTRATVGGLRPGSKDLSFEVRARLASGDGGTSKLLSASTLELPANRILRNPRNKANGDGTVTYSIDALVPFAYMRLFLTDDNIFTTPHNGWPIQYTAQSLGTKFDKIAVASYMFDGNDFLTTVYKYTGDWNRRSTANAPWSWNNITTAKQTLSGYTYSWTFKIDGYTPDWQYQFHGEGYAPTENVCPPQDPNSR